MSMEINDQKLIDIVYVDDDGNKHKYSGPFINDLTITSEIQEKLDALDTLNTQIGELKTKLDTLSTEVTNNSGKDLIQYMMDLPTGVASGVNNVYVLPPEDACPIGISLIQSPFTFNIGWIDLNKRTDPDYNNYEKKYLGIGKHINDHFKPEQKYSIQISVDNKLPTDFTKFTSWENMIPVGYSASDIYGIYGQFYEVVGPSQVLPVDGQGEFIIWSKDNSTDTPVTPVPPPPVTPDTPDQGISGGPVIKNNRFDVPDIHKEYCLFIIARFGNAEPYADAPIYNCYLGFKPEE